MGLREVALMVWVGILDFEVDPGLHLAAGRGLSGAYWR